MRWNSEGYRTAAWVGIVVLGGSIPVLAWLGHWLGVAVVAAFAVAASLFLRYEPRLPALFDFLFAWGAVINGTGYAWDLYPVVPHYDAFVHLCTTFAVTLTFGYLTYHSVRSAFREHRTLFVVAITSFGIAAGVLWEVFEWSAGFIGPIDDTMTDLIMDGLGAAAAALVSTRALSAETHAGGVRA